MSDQQLKKLTKTEGRRTLAKRALAELQAREDKKAGIAKGIEVKRSDIEREPEVSQEVKDKIAELELWLGNDVERRWYTSPNGQVVTHPAVKQIEQMDAQNTAWMSLMGFTPSDRARLGLQEIRVANELDQYRQRKSSVVNAEIVQEV